MGLIDEQRAAQAFGLASEAELTTMARETLQSVLQAWGIPYHGTPMQHTTRSARKLSLTELRSEFEKEMSPTDVAEFAERDRLAVASERLSAPEYKLVTQETAAAFLASLPRETWAIDADARHPIA